MSIFTQSQVFFRRIQIHYLRKKGGQYINRDLEISSDDSGDSDEEASDQSEKESSNESYKEQISCAVYNETNLAHYFLKLDFS